MKLLSISVAAHWPVPAGTMTDVSAGLLRPSGTPAVLRGLSMRAMSVVALLMVAAMFVGVFPTRSYLRQRRERAAVSAQLSELREQNAKLAAEKRRLQSNAEIERIARDRYNLVMPGEKAYAVVPGEVAPEVGSEGSPTGTKTEATPVTAPGTAGGSDANDIQQPDTAASVPPAAGEPVPGPVSDGASLP